MTDLRDIADEVARLWNKARAEGNPNHDTIRRIASLVREIADDADPSEMDDALALLHEAEELEARFFCDAEAV